MTNKQITNLLLHIIKLKERIIRLERENAEMKLKLVQKEWNRLLGKEENTMKYHTHPENGWAWISNQDSRLNYIKFRSLINHLKKKFKVQLMEWESQPVYTYDTTKENLQKEVESWMSL